MHVHQGDSIKLPTQLNRTRPMNKYSLMSKLYYSAALHTQSLTLSTGEILWPPFPILLVANSPSLHLVRPHLPFVPAAGARFARPFSSNPVASVPEEALELRMLAADPAQGAV